MDDVPYDFVDRVFAKFDIGEIRLFDVNSRIWKEAARVYNQKLQIINVCICAFERDDEQTIGIKYKIENTAHSKTFTLDEAFNLDSRFNRLLFLSIYGIDDYDDSMKDMETLELPRLVQYVSQFEQVNVEFEFAGEAPPDLFKMLIESDLRPRSLALNSFFVTGEDFIRKHLRSAHLRRFFMREHSACTSSFYRAVEAFVCQLNFEHLHIASECFDDAAFKRIVAYWREAEQKQEWSIYMRTNHDMSEEFAFWLTFDRDQRFSERIGGFELTIDCKSDYCRLEFYKI